MQKGIILYRSKYGASLRYAQWLKESTGFECLEASKAKIQDVAAYDTVIFGGGIYASSIAGLSFLKKHYRGLQGKRLAVFCVGASPYDEKAFAAVRAHNLKGELSGIPCFYCRGAWEEDKMTVFDRLLCRMLQKSVSKKEPSSCEPWELALRSAMGKRCDWTERRYLDPLLAHLKNEKGTPPDTLPAGQ